MKREVDCKGGLSRREDGTGKAGGRSGKGEGGRRLGMGYIKVNTDKKGKKKEGSEGAVSKRE